MGGEERAASGSAEPGPTAALETGPVDPDETRRLARRHFFRSIAADAVKTAATVVGAAGALRDGSVEMASALLGTADALGSQAAPAARPAAGATGLFRSAFRFEPERVVLLDQRRLPDELSVVDCLTGSDVAQAIRDFGGPGRAAPGPGRGLRDRPHRRPLRGGFPVRTPRDAVRDRERPAERRPDLGAAAERDGPDAGAVRGHRGRGRGWYADRRAPPPGGRGDPRRGNAGARSPCLPRRGLLLDDRATRGRCDASHPDDRQHGRAGRRAGWDRARGRRGAPRRGPGRWRCWSPRPGRGWRVPALLRGS